MTDAGENLFIHLFVIYIYLLVKYVVKSFAIFILYCFEREKERGRERDQFVVPFIDAFIACFWCPGRTSNLQPCHVRVML